MSSLVAGRCAVAGGVGGRLGGGLGGGLMVCGTCSDAGKSVIVAGLCRLLARRGLSVAPFKAQNMALNSTVTASGHEIGRAQYLQAEAAGVVAEVDMNPILLKPTGERSSQVVLMGRPTAQMSAVEYHRAKPTLLPVVLDALARLRRRFDVVVCEGAGSPAEINLLDHDITNLRIAERAGLPALVVGDIDRGGVFASLYGTVALLPPDLRATVRGFVINKLRGDPALLLSGVEQLEAACGVPTVGVVPMLADLHLDAEDSLALDRWRPVPDDAVVDVAVVRFPSIANVTDVDPLRDEPAVGVRLVSSAADLGRPHLIVLPGSKSTVADLAWLRRRGLDRALAGARAAGSVVVGICGGYQMLGRRIVDRFESGAGEVDGLGWLAVDTCFGPDKVLRQVRGTALGAALCGYQIHHGRVTPAAGAQPWLELDGGGGGPEGVRSGAVLGTTVHGLFDADGFRTAFLRWVADRHGIALPPSTLRAAERKEERLDRLADTLQSHLDLDAVVALIDGSRPSPALSPGEGGP